VFARNSPLNRRKTSTNPNGGLSKFEKFTHFTTKAITINIRALVIARRVFFPTTLASYATTVPEAERVGVR